MYEDIVRDFANRTRANLDTIRDIQKKNHSIEIYEVTQLINSLLGLLVFPQQRYVNSIPRRPLSELAKEGWPIPRVIGDYAQVSDLNELIRYLRNAISHFHVMFQCHNSPYIDGLILWNYDPRIRNINWKVELSLQEIEVFTTKFIELLNSHSLTTG
jgi:hypothetical protein